MRLTILVAVAAILAPAVLTVHTASAPGHSQGVTDISAAKKKKAPKAKQKKDEYLKAAPGSGPSGPATKY